MLAPIRFEGTDGVTALDQEQIPQEANLRPRLGARTKVGASELVWTAPRLEDYLIDFIEPLGAQTDTDRCVAYAVCYIRSEAAQTGLLMKVGSDDEAKVYLNGKEIYRCGGGRPYGPDQDEVAGVQFRAGLNPLVFKVVNEEWDWLGSIRFTDAAGQPVKGIRVTLDPDAKD